MNEPTRFFKVFITKHKETLNLSIKNQLIPIGAFAENRPKILLSAFSECSSESGFLISRQRRSNMLRSNSVTRRKLPDF